MAFAIPLVLLMSVIHTGFAFRKKFDKNDDVFEIQDDGMNDCPTEVTENQRGDCIDADSNEIILSQCCDDLRWCNKVLPEFSDAYAAKIMAYVQGCSLLESDVVSTEDSKYMLDDNTRICSSQCQNSPELQDGTLPDYASLKSKCADQAILPKLEAQDNFITVLNDAWSACTTTSTTTFTSTTTTTVATTTQVTTTITSTTTTTTTITRTITTTTSTCTTTTTTRTTTTTSTTTHTTTTITHTTITRTTTTRTHTTTTRTRTTTTRTRTTTTRTITTVTTTITTFTTTVTIPYFFDFTTFFGGDKAKRGAPARFPNDKVYYCCCNPDRDRNSVSCILKSKKIESIEEFGRTLIRRRCGGGMGKDYHSWNNVFNKTHKKDVTRADFEGLENRGKCIVPHDGLPTYMRNMSHSEIEDYLHNSENSEEEEEEEE